MNSQLNLAERLTSAMADKGISTSDLARRVGCTFQAVRKLETGRTKDLMGVNVFLVADALGVSPRWLVTGEAVRPMDGSIRLPLVDAIDQIADAIAALPDKHKVRVALNALLEDDSDLYRQRLVELLAKAHTTQLGGQT